MSKCSPADDTRDDLSNRETYGAPVFAPPPSNQIRCVMDGLLPVCKALLCIEAFCRDEPDERLQRLIAPQLAELLRRINDAQRRVHTLDGHTCQIGEQTCHGWQVAYKLDLAKLKGRTLLAALFWKDADCDPRKGRRNLADGVLALRGTALKRYRELNEAYVFCKTPRPSDWVSVKGDDDPSAKAQLVPDDGEALAQGYCAPSDIAKRFEVSPGALRKRLGRGRSPENYGRCWIENTDAPKNQPRYLYKPAAVMDTIRALKAKRQMSSERPAKKK